MAAGPVTMPERNAMRRLRKGLTPEGPVSEREIARRFRRALTTVQRHVGDLPASTTPAPPPVQRRTLHPVAQARIAAEIAAGAPSTAVALRAGISASWARRIAKEVYG